VKAEAEVEENEGLHLYLPTYQEEEEE